MKEIEKIINAYDQIDWSQERVALGTVVKVEESAYRRIGARMFVSSKGHWIGGISGGCLEGDALKRAQIAINRQQSSIVVYDTMDDDSHQIGVGLGCNGRIEVVFAPIDREDPNNPIEYLRSIVHTRQVQIILQVLRSEETGYALSGRYYSADGIDELAQMTHVPLNTYMMHISKVREATRSQVITLTNQRGRLIEILIECIRPKIKVICVGDNYDVNAFVPIAAELGWEVHIVGQRRKLSKQVFDLAASIVPPGAALCIGVDAYTALVLMSHDYKTDYDLLRQFIGLDIPYIGLLGPRKRTLKMQAAMHSAGREIVLEDMDHVFSPVGLDIGAESPEEIALSITAEIVATLRHREAGFLRLRSGPIHERGQ